MATLEEEQAFLEASTDSASEDNATSKKKTTTDEESLLGAGPIFTPRVSQQRYTFVREMIRDRRSKRVIDMGCGECQLVIKLKREMCIEQLAGVDVNPNLLEASKYFIQPLLYEYIHGRESPLTATLYQGSIAEKDSRLVGWDLLACVEVIEHLEEENLQAVPDVVFGYLRPAVAVFTTPNADFNVLFPDMDKRHFRHWDHKFEWSRKEFQEWGDNICNTYGYTVRYTGVGAGPEGTEYLGMCSQIAVFERLSDEDGGDHNKIESLPYNVVQHSVYPYKPDSSTFEDKILLEAEYYAYKLSIDAVKQHSDEETDYNEDEAAREVVCGQFEDAEGEDVAVAFGGHLNTKKDKEEMLRTGDSAVAFGGHLNTGEENESLRTSADTNARIRILCENEEGSVFVAIPLCELMQFNGLQKICSSVDVLRSVLKASVKVKLSSDETEVLCPVPSAEDDTKSPLLSELYDSQDPQEADNIEDEQQRFVQDDATEESWD